MKFSTAIVALTVGTAGASVVTRNGRRRVQDGAAATDDVALVTDSELLVEPAANNGSSSRDCFLEEVKGVVHLSFEEKGGFTFEYNSEREGVEFLSAAGSDFDIRACVPFQLEDKHEGCNTGSAASRRLEGDEDNAIEADKSSECRGKDSVLYCPMKPGHCATFEITEKLKYCEPRMCEGSCDDYVLVRRPANQQGHFLHITADDSEGPVGSGTLQCGPTIHRELGAITESLYGYNTEDELGNKHEFHLSDCAINSNMPPGPAPVDEEEQLDEELTDEEQLDEELTDEEQLISF